MPMTPAERQKLYRERLKQNNNELYLAQKKANAERTKKNRKKIADVDTSQQEIMRHQWRENKRRNKQKPESKTQIAPSASLESNTEIAPSTPSQNHWREVHSQKRHRKIIHKFKIQNLKLEKEKLALKTNIKNIKKKLKRTVQKNKKILILLDDKNETITKLQQELDQMKIENKTPTMITPNTKTNIFIDNNLPNIPQEQKQTVKKKILQHEVLLSSLKTSFQNADSNKVKQTIKNVVLGENTKKYKLKRKMASFLGLKGNIRHFSKKKLSNVTLVNEIKKFFERDDVSRMTAGKNEVKTKLKEKRQKRYLLGTLKKLYLKYRSEGGKLSLTTFKKYRPFHVIAPTISNRVTCACKKHDNLEMKAKVLKRQGIIPTQDLDALLAMVMCESKRECAYGECELCKENDIEYCLDGISLEDNISWCEWMLQSHEYTDKTDKDLTKITKKMVKQTKTNTLKSLLASFKEELHKMKKHSYNITHQYKEYRRCIESLDERSVLLHIDFSENYVCKLSTEIQSMHFGSSKQQITLHTGILYGKNNKIAFASISPNNDHGPDAIWAHLQPVLQWIRETFPNTDSIHFYSDGPTTQYRQKKNFYYFSEVTKQLNFPYSTWNFFEASHGKGAADGVGGALKRNLDSLVAYGHDIPDAKTAFELLLKETKTSIKLFYIPDNKFLKITAELTPVQNTMKLHQIINTDIPKTIMYRSLSCFCPGERRGFCRCLDIKQCCLIKHTECTNKENVVTKPKTAKLVKTPVTVLSDIKNTADNKKYFDLTKFGPFTLNEIDKNFNIASTSQYDKDKPSTSATMTLGKPKKRKIINKRPKNKAKKYKVQNNSSTDDDAYSLRDSDDDDDYILDENSDDEFIFENLNMPTETNSLQKENDRKIMRTKKIDDKDILDYINNSSENTQTVQENLDDTEVRRNDSVLIRYYQRGNWKYYVGFVEDIIEKEEDNHYKINFLKEIRHQKKKFVIGKKKDWDIVPTNCIIKKIELNRDFLHPSDYFLKNSCDEIYFN